MSEKIKKIEKHMLADELQTALTNAEKLGGDGISYSQLDDGLKMILDKAAMSGVDDDTASLYAALYDQINAKVDAVSKNAGNYFNKKTDKITPDMFPDTFKEAIINAAEIGNYGDKSYIAANYCPKAEQDIINGKFNDSIQKITSKLDNVNTYVQKLNSDMVSVVNAKINEVLPSKLTSYALKTSLDNYMDKATFCSTESGKTVINEDCLSSTTKATLNSLKNFNKNDYYTANICDSRYRSKTDPITRNDLDAATQESLTKIMTATSDMSSLIKGEIISLYNGLEYGTSWYNQGSADFTIANDLDYKYGFCSSWYLYPAMTGIEIHNETEEALAYSSMTAEQKRDIKTLYIYPYGFAHKAVVYADTLGSVGSNPTPASGALTIKTQQGETRNVVTAAKITPILLANYLYSLLEGIAESGKSVKKYVDDKTALSSIRDNLFGSSKISSSDLSSDINNKLNVIDKTKISYTTTTTDPITKQPVVTTAQRDLKISELLERIEQLEAKVAALESK